MVRKLYFFWFLILWKEIYNEKERKFIKNGRYYSVKVEIYIKIFKKN